MQIWMPRDSRRLLGEKGAECQSRSLFMDRFPAPESKQEDRREWFEMLSGKPVSLIKCNAWNDDLDSILAGGPIYAQLLSRLMVNMAGGVMENAGLCLDRFGVPYIPGSAVKGCARRMAIKLLQQQQAASKVELLATIAQVFGWSDQDWPKRKEDGAYKSDFAYAVGADDWLAVREASLAVLPRTEHFAGLVSFLPAYPVDVSGATLPMPVPRLGELELDVVTCHHPEYYKNPNKRGATDDEQPIPVIFPSVAPGHAFVFSVLPLRGCSEAILREAKEWLKEGLTIFGLGAKTAAGYGWFDCSAQVQNGVSEHLRAKAERALADRREKDRREAERRKQEDIEKKRAEERKALEGLSPDEQEDVKVARMSDDQFRSALDNFMKRSAEEQKAVVRSLRKDPDASGSRRGFWEELKRKAQKKGGKLAQIEQAIRQLSKQMFPGKEGKMP